MTLQRAKGKARAQVARPDELPAGVPAAPPAPAGPADRDRTGRFLPGNRTSARGARAKIAKDPGRWARALQVDGKLGELRPEEFLSPFVDDGERWYRAKCQELARDVGAGVASAGVCSLVRKAAWANVYSEFLYACSTREVWAFHRDAKARPPMTPRTDLIAAASRLADSSRGHLLAAHELAAREAEARAKAAPPPHLRLMEQARALATSRAPAEEEPADAADANVMQETYVDQAGENTTGTEADAEESPLPEVLRPFADALAGMDGLFASGDAGTVLAAVTARGQALARSGHPQGSALLEAVDRWKETR